MSLLVGGGPSSAYRIGLTGSAHIDPTHIAKGNIFVRVIAL
jgi:hypothetical protein